MRQHFGNVYDPLLFPLPMQSTRNVHEATGFCHD
jgi:hypothetical protein